MASSLLLMSIVLVAAVSLSGAVVPANETFQLVNSADFGPYIVEYDASYRPLDPFNAPFQLCFYNTTPDAFTLALRMGLRRSESLFRWVWEANRGNPVGENATLTLAADGNLVLAHSDGRVAWETRTANRGVVGFKLLPTGNMVLHDARGNFVWQSFDHPTDTVLVGQALRVGSKLLSRASGRDNVDGPYSLVLEKDRITMYRNRLLYFASKDWFSGVTNVTLVADLNTDQDGATDLGLRASSGVVSFLARPKYNATLSFLRLGSDGNLRIFTYNNKVDWGAWEETYALFSRRSEDNSECGLPERCGGFGLCEDSQCVACPTPAGLTGWSQGCAWPKLTSCGANDFDYYRMVGVDHFATKYTSGSGPASVIDCARKCTRDCKCLGYFYHETTSRCWIAHELNTLTRVANSTHVGFLKAPKTKSA